MQNFSQRKERLLRIAEPSQHYFKSKAKSPDPLKTSGRFPGGLLEYLSIEYFLYNTIKFSRWNKIPWNGIGFKFIIEKCISGLRFLFLENFKNPVC